MNPSLVWEPKINSVVGDVFRHTVTFYTHAHTPSQTHTVDSCRLNWSCCFFFLLLEAHSCEEDMTTLQLLRHPHSQLCIKQTSRQSATSSRSAACCHWRSCYLRKPWLLLGRPSWCCVFWCGGGLRGRHPWVATLIQIWWNKHIWEQMKTHQNKMPYFCFFS